MRNEDKRDFGNLLASVLELRGTTPSRNVLNLWWASLEKYDYQTVLAAMYAVVQDPVLGKFPPVPATLIGAILAVDGRPTADEAWAIAVESFDEGATVCISTEIMTARNAAIGLHDAGDDYGARAAFKAAYDAAIKSARVAGTNPRWTLSIGHDPARREAAVRSAADLGRISQDKAKELLPPPPAEGIPAAVAGLLAGKVVKFPETDDAKARQHLQQIRKALGGK